MSEGAGVTSRELRARGNAEAAWVIIPWTEPSKASRAVHVDLDMPDTCDPLVLIDTPSGPQISKKRPRWLANGKTRWKHQLEIKRIVKAVAKEMGASDLVAEMIWRKAIYESSGNPGSVHVLNRDIEANRRAARKGRRRSTKRWRTAKVAIHRQHRDRLRIVGWYDAWALGRGLYGQVVGLHAHHWSEDAPPWSLCDPVIATVTVIWSMRRGLAECDGATLRDAYRRFSSGKCALRTKRLERRFDVLASGRVRGLRLAAFDPEAPAELGQRWPEERANRRKLVEAIYARLGREAPTLAMNYRAHENEVN